MSIEDYELFFEFLIKKYSLQEKAIKTLYLLKNFKERELTSQN